MPDRTYGGHQPPEGSRDLDDVALSDLLAQLGPELDGVVAIFFPELA